MICCRLKTIIDSTPADDGNAIGLLTRKVGKTINLHGPGVPTYGESIIIIVPRKYSTAHLGINSEQCTGYGRIGSERTILKVL